MNSILQCLSNTRELRDYCLQRLYMRDLGHTSNAHTALMEGEEPRVGVARFHSQLCALVSGWTDSCVLDMLHPSIFLSLPVIRWDSLHSKAVSQTTDSGPRTGSKLGWTQALDSLA